VPAMVLAAVPSNVEGGSYMTFAGPVLAFCIIGAILYVLLFARPVPRVPPRRIAAAHTGPPGPAAAQAAAVAAGMPTAVGGGSTESAVEPAGAHQETTTTDDRGNVSGGTPDGEQGTSEDSEAGE
jgi:hypothetical protein